MNTKHIRTRLNKYSREHSALKQYVVVGDIPSGYKSTQRILDKNRPKLEKWLARLGVDVNVFFIHPLEKFPVYVDSGSRLKDALLEKGYKGSPKAINLCVTTAPGGFKSIDGVTIMPPTAWTVLHRLAHHIVRNEDDTWHSEAYIIFYRFLRETYGLGSTFMNSVQRWEYHPQDESTVPGSGRRLSGGGHATWLPKSIANQLFSFRSARIKDTNSIEFIFEIVTHILVTQYKPRMKLPTALEFPGLEDSGIPATLEMRIPRAKAHKLQKEMLQDMIALTRKGLKRLKGQYIY